MLHFMEFGLAMFWSGISILLETCPSQNSFAKFHLLWSIQACINRWELFQTTPCQGFFNSSHPCGPLQTRPVYVGLKPPLHGLLGCDGRWIGRRVDNLQNIWQRALWRWRVMVTRWHGDTVTLPSFISFSWLFHPRFHRTPLLPGTNPRNVLTETCPGLNFSVLLLGVAL